MRSSPLVFALLLAPAALSAGVVAVRAADATLFYAPGATPEPPMIADRLKEPHHVDPPHGRVCFNQAETREHIAADKLAEPLQALETGRLQGDALRAKLCRWNADEFVYEIAVLRHDGRIVHVYMNAQNGHRVGP